MKFTFDEETQIYVLGAFGLTINNDNEVTYENGDKLTDINGNTIQKNNVNSIINTEKHGLKIIGNVVLTEDNEPITRNNIHALIPISTTDNTAILRDDFSSLCDFIESDY